jgi:hypothetical protein
VVLVVDSSSLIDLTRHFLMLGVMVQGLDRSRLMHNSEVTKGIKDSLVKEDKMVYNQLLGLEVSGSNGSSNSREETLMQDKAELVDFSRTNLH